MWDSLLFWVDVVEAFSPGRAPYLGTGNSERREEILCDGSAGVILKDNTQFSMGPDTEIVLGEFLFAPREGKLGLRTRMLKATTTYQSGKIGKLAPDNVELETPWATLGIRGTYFMVQVEPQ